MIQILVISLITTLAIIYFLLQVTMSSYIVPADYYDRKLPVIRDCIKDYGDNLEKLNQQLRAYIPEGEMSYKIIDEVGSIVYEYGFTEQFEISWWYLASKETEQRLVKGWIKPYVLTYLPIEYKGDYQGGVVLGYGVYPTSTVPILKYIVPYFNGIILCAPFIMLAITLVLYAKRFLRAIEEPLRALQKGISNIEKDNLNFEVKTSSCDEIGELCLSFEKMRLALKESLEANWDKEEERRNIINGLAHDLRTPITVIKGHTELILEDILTEEQMKDSALAIQKNTSRLGRLVEALNQVNKWQQIDNLVDKKEEVDIEEFLKDKVKDYRVLANSKTIDIQYKLTSNLKKMVVHSEAFAQILDNLISNSIRFTPEGGCILILLKVEERRIELKVEDSGCGFTTEDLKQALILFYQGDKSRNSGQHYGIGLHTVDYLVKKMNGTVRLYKALIGGAGVEIIISQ